MKKEVIKHHKKWTTIYLLMIVVYLLLSGIVVYQKWWVALTGIICGLTFSLWKLSEIRTDYKHQLKQVKLMKRLEKNVQEKERQLQAILQKELEKKKQENNRLKIMKFKYNFLENKLRRSEGEYTYEISENNYFRTQQGNVGNGGFQLGERQWIFFTFNYDSWQILYQKGDNFWEKTLRTPNSGELVLEFTEADRK